MRPPEVKGRPPVSSRESGPDASSATITTVSINQQGDSLPGATRKHRPPRVHASVYEPCWHRTWWWYAYLCPWCGGGHLGRARAEQQAAGPHRSGCGRMVLIVAARTYRARPASGAAA
jgi:hypothetical protein